MTALRTAKMGLELIEEIIYFAGQTRDSNHCSLPPDFDVLTDTKIHGRELFSSLYGSGSVSWIHLPVTYELVGYSDKRQTHNLL